jgi:hypothetical protein
MSSAEVLCTWSRRWSWIFLNTSSLSNSIATRLRKFLVSSTIVTEREISTSDKISTSFAILKILQILGSALLMSFVVLVSPDASLENSSTLRCAVFDRWTIVIRDRKMKRNMNHSFSLVDLLSEILNCSADFNAEWSVIIVNWSSSKYWDSLMRAHTRASTSSSVAQYRVFASMRHLNRNNIERFTSFVSIWWSAISYSFFLLSSTYRINDREKSEYVRVSALLSFSFSFS